MKAQTCSLPAVLALAGLVACAHSRPTTTPDPTGIADTISAAMNAYMDALRAGDQSRAVEWYAAEPSFRVITGESVLTYEQVIALQTQARYRQFLGEWDTLAVTVVTADSAIASGHFWQIIVDSASNATPFRGRAFWTWVRRPSGWQVLVIQATPDP